LNKCILRFVKCKSYFIECQQFFYFFENFLKIFFRYYLVLGWFLALPAILGRIQAGRAMNLSLFRLP